MLDEQRPWGHRHAVPHPLSLKPSRPHPRLTDRSSQRIWTHPCRDRTHILVMQCQRQRNDANAFFDRLHDISGAAASSMIRQK